MSLGYWILLADIESVIKVIAFLIFFIVPLISQLLGGEGGKTKKEVPRPKNRPPRPVGERDQQPQVPFPFEAIERAKNAGKTVDMSGTPQTNQREPLAKSREGLGTQRGRAASAPSGGRQQAKKKPAPRQLGQGVGGLAQQHLDPKNIREHSKDLGRNVDQADERVESHLRQVFDHGVGHLAGELDPQAAKSTSQVSEGTDAASWQRAPIGAAPETDPALDARRNLISLLRTPQGIRQALILNEIMNSPKGMQE